MKLNLLPTYVSKEKATRGALILGILFFIVCVGASVFLFTKATNDLNTSKADIPVAEGKAEKAKLTAESADRLLTSENAVRLLRNTKLAEAMLAHNAVYPALYDDIKQKIPNFFRVNSMSAQSGGAGVTQVTLVGVLDTYQQYADLMLALLRIPGTQTVSRSGFVDNSPYVPAPSEIDQYGRPRKPNDAPIPDDPLKRLEYFQGQGSAHGYDNSGGFGSGVPGIRGPMPTSQQVTITLVISRDVQVPDPRATLTLGGGASSGGNAGSPPATGNTPPAGGPTVPQKGGRKGVGE